MCDVQIESYFLQAGNLVNLSAFLYYIYSTAFDTGAPFLLIFPVLSHISRSSGFEFFACEFFACDPFDFLTSDCNDDGADFVFPLSTSILLLVRVDGNGLLHMQKQI